MSQRERECPHLNDDGIRCSGKQSFRMDAGEAHAYAGFARRGEYPKLLPRHPGWECATCGKLDQPTPEEVLYEACQLLRESDLELTELLRRFEFRQGTSRNPQTPQDVPSLPAPVL
jgi:hypothetical protein